MENLIFFVGILNDILWIYILIGALISIGLYFGVKTKFLQFRHFGEMFKLLKDSTKEEIKDIEEHTEGKALSSFQAFCMSTASRVGTGNLAGVAMAISIGGPGAVFWMWLIALIGSVSSFVESVLAQVYKVDNGDGTFRGGPAYYMEKGLKNRKMGIVFSILITICFGLVFNAVQSNTITLAFQEAFGINRAFLGVFITFFTALIIFGGAKRIAHVSEIVVPIMAIIYILVAVFIIGKNISYIPEVFKMIFGGAFGVKQLFGGGIGVAMLQGVKRGLFSNEAGMGSAPNAGAAAKVSHPVKQGFVQALGVFVDTLLICTATAFIVIISNGSWVGVEGLEGIAITQRALSSQVGSWGNTFVAISILLFAFSSIIGNYYYGETNIEFIRNNKKSVLFYRITVLAMVMFGSISKIQLVWDLADLFMGLMAVINLIAIVKLGKVAFILLKDYEKQKEKGIDPVFKLSSINKKDKKVFNLENLSKEWD